MRNGGDMDCPVCNKENDDNWPLDVDSKIKDGGCQDCWEDQCDDGWWRSMEALLEMQLDIGIKE